MLVKGSSGLSEVTRGTLPPANEGSETAEARMLGVTVRATPSSMLLLGFEKH
jgi:hypothetical protein